MIDIQDFDDEAPTVPRICLSDDDAPTVASRGDDRRAPEDEAT